MAAGYICFRVTITDDSSASNFGARYFGTGNSLIYVSTGYSATQAESNLASTSVFTWIIRSPKTSTSGTYWIYSMETSNCYVAVRCVRPCGYSSVYSGKATSGSTPLTSATFSISMPRKARYMTSAFVSDLVSDRQSITTVMSDIDSFSSYEDMALCPATSSTYTVDFQYGGGEVIAQNSNLGTRYAVSYATVFRDRFEQGEYFTSQPAEVNTGYTVTVNSSTVGMTVSDQVQGYGTHSIRLISVYAVTTGGTETLILSKPGATTLSFGINTISLGRQTTTVNGVIRFKLSFLPSAFNGVGATECAVQGFTSEVTPYQQDLDSVEMYTEDINRNMTFTSSSAVDLILSTDY